MRKCTVVILVFYALTLQVLAQPDSIKGSFWKPNPRNYEVKQAIEFESLFPMFLSGGFHFAACYRYEKFRVRVSVINGGSYDAEPAGLKNSSAKFKRYYKTSPGIFLGYNVWENLEVYTYVESHTFEIEQKSSSLKKNIHSTDWGGGVSYQFFIGSWLYIQPGMHIYWRADNSIGFGDQQYHVPNVDLSPVLRVGVRYWRQY